jgi:hypothetical protein
MDTADDLDGCELDFTENPTDDDLITWLVLFQDADDEIFLADQWNELFNA